MPKSRDGRGTPGARVAPSQGRREADEPSTPANGTDASADPIEDVLRRAAEKRSRDPGQRQTRDAVEKPRTPLDVFLDALADYCARLDVARGRAPTS